MVFYQVVANIYINLVGFLLAYFRIFYAGVVWILVGAVPLVVKIFFERKRLVAWFGKVRRVLTDALTGTYGVRKLCSDVLDRLKKKAMIGYTRFFKNRILEWVLIAAAVGYLVWFYGWYKFHNAGYGHTDEETHLFWIQSILENNAFPTGMYPHGLHFLVAVLTSFFGISAVGAYLNISVFSTILIFLFLYATLRGIFRSKYAVLFGWLFFLVTDFFSVTTYFRFQFSFPMEFGIVAVMAAVFGLVYYLKERDNISFIIFVLSITWSFYAHFYCTILTAFLCLAFGIVFLVLMIRRKILVKVLLGGLIGIFLAMLPFGCGYVMGHDFERSISWAIGIMNGDDGLEKEDTQEESLKEEEPPTFSIRHLPNLDTVASYLAKDCFRTKTEAYGAMILFCGLMLYGLLGTVFSRKQRIQYLLYVFLSLSWLFGMGLYLCYFVGLPVLIEMKRSATFLSVLTVPLFIFPFQLLADLVRLLCRKEKMRKFENITLIIAGFLLLSAVWESGTVKEERYYEITISEADARLCMDLLENKEPFTWTVISPTNDLAMIRRGGYHYEILDLLEEIENGKRTLYIPTKYVYVVIENRIIDFNNSRREIDGSDRAKMAFPVSIEDALDDSVDIYHYYGDSPDRAYYFQRKTIMSRLYYWMERIKTAYPTEVSVYYEDSTCTVYQIEQDEYFLLNLAVKYQQDLEVEALH